VEAQNCGLAAGPGGVQHSFVWDTVRDVHPAGTSSVRIRITPFDEDRGLGAESPNDFLVQNGLYPAEIPVLAGQNPLSGTAIGDLDGDARPDIALSLVEAPSFPGDPACQNQRGRVDVFFREPDGTLSATPFSLVPGRSETARPCEPRERGPLDLLIADWNSDGRNDLLVLDSNCPRAKCEDVRGDVSIFLGREPPLTIGPEPPLTITIPIPWPKNEPQPPKKGKGHGKGHDKKKEN
jgi:hypothetical protein